MARVLVYFAHPGYRYSQANRAMAQHAQRIDGITSIDLYAKYPRFEIDIDEEQQLLLEHEVIVFQFPLFWYSTPSLLKEWLDLVLEHGFAYGSGGDQLAGRSLLLAVTAAGDEEAYRPEGDHRYLLRTFLTPLEQTASLCQMHFLAPYVLFGALRSEGEGRLEQHAVGFARLLEALRDERFDLERARCCELVQARDLDHLVKE